MWLEIFRKLSAIILAIVSFFNTLGGSFKVKTETVSVNGSYAAVDQLGRRVVTAGSSDKKVGIFYFLWMGEHGAGGPYDNTKLLAEHPDAVESVEKWQGYGGGGYGEFHFWGEPLFGYYLSRDKWVIRKHLQMLTDAGIDFVVFDVTNGFTYIDRVRDFISVWYDHMEEGWDVPKLAFYTNSASGSTMNQLHDGIYENAQLKAQYPDLDRLWFRLDDTPGAKPMIIGNPEDPELREDVRDYFRIKHNQWPNSDKNRDGFPWMEFDRNLTVNAIYKNSLKDKSIMNVSVAQHCDSVRFSATAWYGANDHTRNWHDGSNDGSADALLYGYNFEEQWDFAIGFDPDIVFVTGFNEWIAQRLNFADNEPIGFCDNCTEACSRDTEPAAGPISDNYYMQLVRKIAEYKGKTAVVDRGGYVTIDPDKGFSQWDSSSVTAVYRDYKNDTVDRNCAGYGDLYYTDTTGRNDIVTCKAARDEQKMYFYVETADALTSPDGGNWMTLYLNTSGGTDYDFCIDRDAPENGKTAVMRINGGECETVGYADIRFEGNKLMIAVDKALLGLDASDCNTVMFKWADNCAFADFDSFYLNGDCAPYGRLNYVF